jgi:hypothetical protein
MTAVEAKLLKPTAILTLLQLASFAGCLMVFGYLFSMFPLGDDPNLAEEYGIVFLVMGWIAYCLAGCILSYFAGRLLSGLNAVLIAGVVIAAFTYGLQFLQTNKNLPLLGLLILLFAFSLPLILGWATGRKWSIRNTGPSWGGNNG